jgi:two-component system chemotaxis response regulator CheY
MKTLIVEDDFISQQVMKELLSTYGEVNVAGDGNEALQIFIENLEDISSRFDLILLDIMMPEIDGLEALQYIRNLEDAYSISGLDAVKVVMTTALDSFENINKAFKNQCDAYLVKPIDRPKMERLLKDLNLIE